MRIYEICESCFKFNNTYHDDDNMICDNRFHTVVNDIHIFIYRNHSKTYEFKVALIGNGYATEFLCSEHAIEVLFQKQGYYLSAENIVSLMQAAFLKALRLDDDLTKQKEATDAQNRKLAEDLMKI